MFAFFNFFDVITLCNVQCWILSAQKHNPCLQKAYESHEQSSAILTIITEMHATLQALPLATHQYFELWPSLFR